LRQQRGVRKLEQKQASRENKETTIFEQGGAADPLRVGSVMIVGATRPGEVNVARAYSHQRENQWHPQRSQYQKNIPGGQEITDHTHDRGRRKATDGGEALIAAEPLGERVVPHESQTDSGDTWTQDASGRALYDSGSDNRWEVGPQPENQQRQSDSGGSRTDERAP